MDHSQSYKIFPLGDSAIVVDFGNIIDKSINERVYNLFYQLQNNSIPGMIEVVPAYSSLTIYYNVPLIRSKLNYGTLAYNYMVEKIKTYLADTSPDSPDKGNLLTVPVCYEKDCGPDLEFIALKNHLSVEEIIHLHTSVVYHVYMIGFLPGFAYMASVDEKISSPRKQQPVSVEAGSVGIAGRQTGIYPLRSPGGWQIIGRTPLKLFDKEKKDPVMFKTGDKVQFISINRDEFEDIKSRNT